MILWAGIFCKSVIFNIFMKKVNIFFVELMVFAVSLSVLFFA